MIPSGDRNERHLDVFPRRDVDPFRRSISAGLLREVEDDLPRIERTSSPAYSTIGPRLVRELPKSRERRAPAEDERVWRALRRAVEGIGAEQVLVREIPRE